MFLCVSTRPLFFIFFLLLQVNPEAMGRLYRDVIIPLTKEVEVDYLMKRI
jgi:hypothetical protein